MRTCSSKFDRPHSRLDDYNFRAISEPNYYLTIARREAFLILEHFSYCCRALNGSRNQALASSAVSMGSICAMA